MGRQEEKGGREEEEGRGREVGECIREEERKADWGKSRREEKLGTKLMEDGPGSFVRAHGLIRDA